MCPWAVWDLFLCFPNSLLSLLKGGGTGFSKAVLSLDLAGPLKYAFFCLVSQSTDKQSDRLRKHLH